MSKGKVFKGFSDTQMKRIAEKSGYTGDIANFKKFLASNPALGRKFSGLEEKARMKFAEGGVVNQEAYDPTARPDPNEAYDPNQPRLQFGAEGYNEGDRPLGQTYTTDVPLNSTPQPENYTQKLQPNKTGSDADSTLTTQLQNQSGYVPPPIDQEGAENPFENYQQGMTAYMNTYAEEAPENIKGIKTRSDEIGSELSTKYQAQGQALTDQFESKYRAKANAATTPELKAALDAEIAADTEYQNTLQMYRDGVTGDPLYQEMQRGKKEYSDYMQAGQAQYGQDNPAPNMVDVTANRAFGSTLPAGGVFNPAMINQDPNQIMDSGTGQIEGAPPAATTNTVGTTLADDPTNVNATLMDGVKVEDDVRKETDALNAAQGEVSEEAKAKAQEMDPTSTEVGTVGAPQIEEATKVVQPSSRTLQSGETVEAVANAKKGAAFAEEITAATANPSAAATVKGQLTDLMEDFDGGATPPWAAGALRNATAMMAARGLSASSMAGQAIVQAAMESALPIAQADAATQASFESQNLSNRQARAMLAAEQRATFMGQEFDQKFQARVANAAKVSDIANMNFNAEQQIALENARIANSVDLANLDSSKAMALAEAAQIANLETTNLNNRQQSAVQNAQAFLQMDLTNLDNEQQTAIFKSQQNIQALLSDQAAENATRQFNASSQTQTDQFMANLASQISQYNATQTNAMAQYNESNSVDVQKFNNQIKEARDQFNADNQLVIAQSNVNWRRDLATADTVAINAAHETNARAILDMSTQAYDNLWQSYGDAMEYVYKAGEGERDRINKLMQIQLQNDGAIDVAKLGADGEKSKAFGSFLTRAIFSPSGVFGD